MQSSTTADEFWCPPVLIFVVVNHNSCCFVSCIFNIFVRCTCSSTSLLFCLALGTIDVCSTSYHHATEASFKYRHKKWEKCQNSVHCLFDSKSPTKVKMGRLKNRREGEEAELGHQCEILTSRKSS